MADSKKVSFSDVNAADRWLANLHRSLLYARKIHGDSIISKDDIAAWDSFVAKWNPFRNSLGNLSILWMSADNKNAFHSLMNQANDLQKRFEGKNMAIIPVPYGLEIVSLMRSIPKNLTAKQMVEKIAIAVKCGDRLLDDHAPWYGWRKGGDAKGLAQAVDQARAMGVILSRSKDSNAKYYSGDPVFDEFVRRITKIWIEASGLYGIVEKGQQNLADLKSDLKKGAKDSFATITWILATTAIGYVGLKLLSIQVDREERDTQRRVAVPDAIPIVDQPPLAEG